jgi:hypothetical protein
LGKMSTQGSDWGENADTRIILGEDTHTRIILGGRCPDEDHPGGKLVSALNAVTSGPKCFIARGSAVVGA